MTITHRKRLTISLLFAIFLVPMLVAWLAYSSGLFLSTHTVNHGFLMDPPISVASLSLKSSLDNKEIATSLKGRWWLMYLTDSPSEAQTTRALYFMRQIRQSTGKDRARIERALITTSPLPEVGAWLAQNYPGTSHFSIGSKGLSLLEAKVSKKLALRKGSLYLVDPLGNVMMFYAPDAAPKGILKDLQRVLKVSQIG